MKRLFDFLMRKYYFGLKWYASSGIEEELIAQVFYIQALICGLRILYQMDPQKILGYMTFTIFYAVFCLLYYNKYLFTRFSTILGLRILCSVSKVRISLSPG